MSIDLEAFADLHESGIEAAPAGLKDTIDYLDVILTSRRTFVYLGSFAEMQRWLDNQRALMGECDPEKFLLEGNIESVSQNGGMIQLNFASTDE